MVHLYWKEVIPFCIHFQEKFSSAQSMANIGTILQKISDVGFWGKANWYFSDICLRKIATYAFPRMLTPDIFVKLCQHLFFKTNNVKLSKKIKISKVIFSILANFQISGVIFLIFDQICKGIYDHVTEFYPIVMTEHLMKKQPNY